jgi:capsid protein
LTVSPSRELRANDTPSRTIVFSSYYDATATTKEQDYGNFSAIVQEDFYLSSSLRSIALGRLRREASNNPYLAGLVEKYPEAVGYALLRSRSSKREYNIKKERWWKKLAKRITSAGDSLRTLEAIVKIEMLLAGELFLVTRLDGTVQVIPSEFCGSPALTPIVARPGGGREVNGILYDQAGNRTHYRFGKITPGGLLSYEEAELVPAEWVIHIFHKKRVHQGRGLPWLLASLRTARDLYEITRSKTKQIKDANAISGFIEKQNAAEFLPGMSSPEIDAAGEPKKEERDDPADRVKKDGPIVIELKPGTFIALEPGEKIHSLMSQYNATDYKELIMLMLHAMSTPVGLPVELWFSGLGDVNYSGYKGLGVQWNGRRQDVIEFLNSSFYMQLYAWRVGKATNEGELEANPDGDEENIELVFRRTPILDDEKEGKSNKIKLESGETDLAAIWEEQGYSPEEIFLRRRQTWIKMKIAAGELDENGDHSAEKVPIGYLHRNELPGETTVPHIPDGTGQGDTENADAAAAEAKSSADAAGSAANESKQASADARAALRSIQQIVAAIQRA